MHFSTVSIIRQPVELVWNIMCDQFPQIGDLIDEIDYIRREDLRQLENGDIETVHIWKSSPDLPAMVKKFIQPDMLSWTDTALWKSREFVCEWKIDSHYFQKGLKCSGRTVFEPAIGGRGCRLTFAGDLHWEGGGLPAGMGLLGDFISKGLEPLMGQLLPGNFRKITQAVETLIAAQSQG